MPEDIRAAMATRDLMSAISALAALPADLLKLEYLDLELSEGRLSALLEQIYDRNTVRELRLRPHGHAQATSRPMVVREVSQAGELERHST